MKLFNEIAYHSSKQKGLKKFNKNTNKSKAFKGEGHQVHGWGLYLQADKEINIKRYKLGLKVSEGKVKIDDDVYVKVKGHWVSPDGTELNFSDISAIVMETLARGRDIQSIKNECQEWINEGKRVQTMQDALDFINSHSFENMSENILPSQYAVEIPDNMVFLEEDTKICDWSVDMNTDIIWDLCKAITDKYPDKVMNMVRDKDAENPLYTYLCDSSGYAFYCAIADVLGSQQKTSNYLSKHGIDGMKYNGDVDGDCYVIFSCDKLKILNEE